MIARLNKLTFLLVIVATCCDCKATVLYVRFTSREILIGADSKRTLEDGNTACVCKITQIGDTFFATAGLAEYGTFDPGKFAREAISTSRTISDSRTKFEDLIAQPLIDVLKKLRSNDKPRYEAFKRGAALNMIFIRFSDLPELAAIAFTPKDGFDGSISLDKTEITFAGSVRRPKRILVGFSKRAESFLDQPGLWSNGTVAGVQRVLQIAIADNSEAGEPIDVVQITKGAARWFPREPECDDKSRRTDGRPSTCNSSKH